MTRADWNLPPVDGVPGYLHARQERDRLNPPLRPVPQRSDDQCIQCGMEVPSEFEPDPDRDASGGVLILEHKCPICAEAWCEQCQSGPNSECPECREESDDVEAN